MEMQDKPDPTQAEILPVVRYAATAEGQNAAPTIGTTRRCSNSPCSAAIIDDADNQLGDVLAMVTEPWQLDTTAAQSAPDPRTACRSRRRCRLGRNLEQALGGKRAAMEAQPQSA